LSTRSLYGKNINMEILFRKDLLEYKEPGHPECPERLAAIINFLEKKSRNKFNDFEGISDSDLEEVHSQYLIDMVRKGNFFNPDTPNIPGIYRYACLSAGGAIAAARRAINGSDACALIRPPGHHSGRDFLGGFCYFNNIALAVKQCLKTVKRVGILDIDGHHGNGTESIFKDFNNIIFISIHQADAYPGTGTHSFSNCYNFPMPAGTSFSDYKIYLLEALGLIRRFSPDILGISLGFDTHIDDPLLKFCFRDSDYYHMARMIASNVSMPVFIVLEGGYDIISIGNAFYCFLSGWEIARSK